MTLAGMTDASDGDFARPDGRPESEVFALANVPRRPVITLRQVHGTRVETAGAERDMAQCEGDGLLTRDAGIAIGVRVADCVPVFLLDPDTRTAGIVHAGRQGTFDGIAEVAVREMQRRFSAVPTSLHAVIGPSAGPCCYEVSDELADAFRDRGYPVAGRRLNLWAANQMQLERCGVQSGRIAASGVCTICSGRYHSYRATGTPSRNLAVIAL